MRLAHARRASAQVCRGTTGEAEDTGAELLVGSLSECSLSVRSLFAVTLSLQLSQRSVAVEWSRQVASALKYSSNAEAKTERGSGYTCQIRVKISREKAVDNLSME